jgi:alpha-mannosidase
VEAVKLADDRSGDVVVRLYESHGGRATTSVTAGFPVSVVTEVDLLERDLADDQRSAGPVVADGGRVRLTLRPFQVVTIRFRPARSS